LYSGTHGARWTSSWSIRLQSSPAAAGRQLQRIDAADLRVDLAVAELGDVEIVRAAA
jgi:hypothetical protein